MITGVLDRELTTSVEAASAYREGDYARALALDPTFALAHAALALFGDELAAPVDVRCRLECAELHARRSTAAERDQVGAIVRHLRPVTSSESGRIPQQRVPGER